MGNDINLFQIIEENRQLEKAARPERRIADISKRGEAFWASLVTMIVEGIVVNLFSLPIGAVVAFVIFTTSEGDELTLLDYAGYADFIAALIIPPLVIISNLLVMLFEKSNEHEGVMKAFNAVVYCLYPIICLGIVAAYWMFR